MLPNIMKLNATLFFPWIDPYEILEKYRRGEYSNVTAPEVKEKIQAKLTQVSAEKYDTDMNKKRFHMKVNGGEIVVISSCPMDRTAEIKCRRCNHVVPKDSIPECVVVKRETHQRIELIDGIPTAVNYKEFFMHRDPFCSFNCALGEVGETRGRYPAGAEENIRYLHKCIYPDAGLLVKTPDPSLLDINGGTYTYDEYTASGKERHIPIGGLVVTSVRSFSVKM